MDIIVWVPLGLIIAIILIVMGLGNATLADIMQNLIQGKNIFYCVCLVINFFVSIMVLPSMEGCDDNKFLRRVSFLLIFLFDGIKMIGFMAVILTEMNAFSNGVEGHFLEMLLIAPIAIAEMLLFAVMALAGAIGCSCFAIHNCMFDSKIKTIVFHIVNCIWTPVFMALCQILVLEHYKGNFMAVFGGSWVERFFPFT